MTTTINKTPQDVVAAIRANKPTNGTSVLFLVKSGQDIPIFGFHTIGNDIFVVKQDRSEVAVDIPDIIELRK